MAFMIMSHRRTVKYVIQGTSSSSTWRARIYPFLNVLTSVSIFSCAWHKPLIVELPRLYLKKPNVVDIELAYFSDTSAILDLLSTHRDHNTPFCAPCLFLSQTLRYFDDDLEIFLSLTFLMAVLQFDAANCVGGYEITPALVIESITSFVPSLQSSASKLFCITICFTSRVRAHRQKTFAGAIPNYAWPFLRIEVKMGLTQILTVTPVRLHLKPFAPLTVITGATRNTDSAQPDSMFTISIYHLLLLVLHQINSAFYRPRPYSGSGFIEVVFDDLTRNLSVPVLSDIKVHHFLVLLVDATLCRAVVVVETLAPCMWVTSNAKGISKLLRVERGLDSHCNPRIALCGSQKPCSRSIDVHTYVIDKVLNINRPFQKEDYMELHHDVLFRRAREDVPHVVTAWSLMCLDCFVQTALRHYTWNHRSDIKTNIVQAALEGRTSNARWSRGLLITAQSVSSSVQRFAIDYDGVFVDDVKVAGSPDMHSTFGSVQFFLPRKVVESLSLGDVVYQRMLPPAFRTLQIPIDAPLLDLAMEVLQVVAHTLRLVEPYVMCIQGDSLEGLERIKKVSTWNDTQPNTFNASPIRLNRDHLESASGSTRLPEPLLLRHGNSSRSSQDFDSHSVKYMSRNIAMGTLHAFCVLSEIERFGSSGVEDSGTIPGISSLPKEHQVPIHQLIAEDVAESSISPHITFDKLDDRGIAWIRNQKYIASTEPLCYPQYHIHDGNLPAFSTIQQSLDIVRGSTTFHINELFKTCPALELFLDCSSVPLRPIIRTPDSSSVICDVNASVILPGNISAFGRRRISQELCLVRYPPVSSTSIDALSELHLKDNENSAVASSHSESSNSPIHVWKAHFQTSSNFSQHSAQENARAFTFKVPLSQLADLIRSHRVDGIPVCPAFIYIEQVFVSLNLPSQHLYPTDDKHVVLRAIEFVRPLVYDEHDRQLFVVELSPQYNGQGTFFVASGMEGGTESIHVRGKYKTDLISRISTKFRHALPMINYRISSIFRTKNGKGPQRFCTRTIYEVILSRIVEYNKEYQAIQSLTVDPDGVEGYAFVKLPASSGCRSRFKIHHVFIDALLQVAGIVVNLRGGANEAYIYSRIDSIIVIPNETEDELTYGIYCSHFQLAPQGAVLADAYAVNLAYPSTLVARLKGIHFRKVRLDSLKMGAVHDVRGSTRDERRHPVHTTPSSSTSAVFLPPAANLQNSGLASIRPASSVWVAQDCLAEEGLRTLAPQTIDKDADVQHTAGAAMNACVGDIGEDDNSKELGLCASASPRIITAFSTKSGIEAPDPFLNDHRTSKTVQSHFASCPSFERSRSPEPTILPEDARHLATDGDSRPKTSLSPTTAARLNKALKLGDIPLLLQRSTTSSLPLFLIHDGSGLINYYHGIPSLGRQVWGINNPKFISSEQWQSVTEMASFYAYHIARVVTGPVILGGWSFGGVVAYEVSLQLAKKGIVTRGILLVDSPNPINHVPLSEDLIDSIVKLDARGTTTDLRRLVKAQFTLNADMLGFYNPRETEGTCPPLVLLRSSEGFSPPGLFNVPPWLADRSDPRTATLGWETLAGESIRILDIPGHHFTPFKPNNITRVCERMMEACALFERG